MVSSQIDDSVSISSKLTFNFISQLFISQLLTNVQKKTNFYNLIKVLIHYYIRLCLINYRSID